LGDGIQSRLSTVVVGLVGFGDGRVAGFFVGLGCRFGFCGGVGHAPKCGLS
jgi:hypothetical protein